MNIRFEQTVPGHYRVEATHFDGTVVLRVDGSRRAVLAALTVLVEEMAR